MQIRDRACKGHQLNKFEMVILIMIDILIMYIAISTIFPPIRVLVWKNTLIVSLFMSIFFIVSFIIEPSFYLNPTKQRFATLVFIVYTFTVPYLFSNPTIGNRYLDFASIFLFYIAYEFNDYVRLNRYNKTIIITTVPFFLYTLIRTGAALVDNPSISRSIKSSGEHTISLFTRGIGGYEFIYFLMFLAIISSYFLISKNANISKTMKSFTIITFLGSVLVVILSNYFMAFLVMTFSIISIIILSFFIQKKYLNIVILSLTSILLILMWKEIAILILDIAVEIIDTGYNHIRLLAIKNNVIYGTNVDISSDRLSVFMVSFTSFLERPIFGIITNPIQTSAGFLTGFGQHSHIMDTYALFGAGIGTLQLYIICQPFIKRIKTMKYNWDLSIVVFISMLIIFNYNIVTPSIGFVLFMIFPSLADYLVMIHTMKEK